MRITQAASSITLGAAFFLGGASAAPCPHPPAPETPPPLAVALFAEGDWRACRAECLRQLAAGAAIPATRLLAATCAARLGAPAATAALAAVLAAGDTPPAVAAMASLELGRAHLAAGNPDAAIAPFRAAFTQTDDQGVSLRAGFHLYQLLDPRPDAFSDEAALALQLASCRPLWTARIRDDCRMPSNERRRLLTRPAEWLIGFYRHQIGPAIGDRCSLVPSCSQYAIQALSRHGLSGIPIMGDRFIREPSVVAARENQVLIHGKRYYRDPLEDHEW